MSKESTDTVKLNSPPIEVSSQPETLVIKFFDLKYPPVKIEFPKKVGFSVSEIPRGRFDSPLSIGSCPGKGISSFVSLYNSIKISKDYYYYRYNLRLAHQNLSTFPCPCLDSRISR